MIKKSTLIILLTAIALGAGVYYFDWKRGQKDSEKSTAEASKPAFSFPSGSQIVSLVLTRPQVANEAPVHLEKQNGIWQITQPLRTEADQHIVGAMIETLGNAQVESNEPGTPDRLKVFGLDPPAVSLEFKLQDGSPHSVKLGNKDFTNTNVYAQIDNAKDVALLPTTLRTQTDLSLDALRDHSVLHIMEGTVTSFSLKNPAGEVEAKKEKTGWTFTKPDAGQLADDSEVTSLLNAVAGALMTGVVSESSENLTKYGLSSPTIIFTASISGEKGPALLIGKKDGNDYFAKDSSRPTIFKVSDSFYKNLTKTHNDLRDKKLIHLSQSDLNGAELHNANGTLIITPKTEQDWIVDAPADLKGKDVSTWKIFPPAINARAEEILDHPSADIISRLAKPLVELTLTAKDGKKLTLSLSPVIGDSVYARTSASSTVYKLRKEILTDLNVKLSDFAIENSISR